MNNSSTICNPLNSQEISLTGLLVFVPVEDVHIFQGIKPTAALDLVQGIGVIHIQLILAQHGNDRDILKEQGLVPGLNSIAVQKKFGILCHQHLPFVGFYQAQVGNVLKQRRFQMGKGV